jgi:hypothetical protein
MAGTDSQQDASTGRRPRGGDRHVFGLLLIGLGTVWFLSESHLLALSAETVLSVLLILLALGLIYTARWGRRMGRFPILLGMGLTFALIVNSPSLHFASFRGGVGDQNVVPQTIGDVQPDYRTSFGDFTLDLRAIPVAELATRPITVHMVAGSVTVILRPSTLVDLSGRVRAGQLTACDQQLGNGFDTSQSFHSPGNGPRLALTIDAGFGDVEIQGCQPESPATPASPSATLDTPTAPTAPTPPPVGIPGA